MNNENNAILNTRRSMPLKDLSSNNENVFSMNRNIFTKTTEPTVDNSTYLMKKYYGASNRDSSVRTYEKKNVAIGSDLVSNDQKFSFTNIGKNNITQNQALQRVRNKGYIIPMKSRK